MLWYLVHNINENSNEVDYCSRLLHHGGNEIVGMKHTVLGIINK